MRDIPDIIGSSTVKRYNALMDLIVHLQRQLPYAAEFCGHIPSDVKGVRKNIEKLMKHQEWQWMLGRLGLHLPQVVHDLSKTWVGMREGSWYEVGKGLGDIIGVALK